MELDMRQTSKHFLDTNYVKKPSVIFASVSLIVWFDFHQLVNRWNESGGTRSEAKKQMNSVVGFIFPTENGSRKGQK